MTDIAPGSMIYIAQAVYYTLVIVVAVAGVHRLAIRAADRMQSNIIKSSVEVLKEAVLQERRHTDHERRLDDMERTMSAIDESHHALVEQVSAGFAEIKDLMRNHQTRVDELFAMAARGSTRKE
jgi:hypothetical protein